MCRIPFSWVDERICHGELHPEGWKITGSVCRICVFWSLVADGRFRHHGIKRYECTPHTSVSCCTRYSTPCSRSHVTGVLRGRGQPQPRVQPLGHPDARAHVGRVHGRRQRRASPEDCPMRAHTSQLMHRDHACRNSCPEDCPMKDRVRLVSVHRETLQCLGAVGHGRGHGQRSATRTKGLEVFPLFTPRDSYHSPPQ